MKIRVVLASAAMLMLLGGVGIGQETKPAIYDDFSQRWLDPDRWDMLTGWISCWSHNLECVREIQNGKLRLASRTIGERGSDDGNFYSSAELLFNHDLTAVLTSIQADVTVREFGGVPCPANTSDVAHTQVEIGGNFFNSGTGNPDDDVLGWLIIWVDATNPKLMQVGNYWGWGAGHGWQGYWTFVASYRVNTPLVASFTWDRSNHQFVAKVWPKGDPGSVAQVASSYGDYGVSDAYRPSDPTKKFVAATAAMNCTSVLSDSHVDVLFDNVIVDQ
jgi:hypothetical protein